MKELRPVLIMGIGGCMAQREGIALLKKLPGLDMVFGTQAIGRVPGLISKLEESRRPWSTYILTARQIQ